MRLLIVIALTSCALLSVGQNPVTFQEADQALQKNNLLLLAEQFNISGAQAAVIQARIWDQPYLSGEFNLVNTVTPQWLDVGASGQKSFAVQQLIYLGGKKKNEVALAKSNVELAQLQFEQLLRNLRFQLAQNFFTAFFDQQKVITLNAQISTLEELIQAYQAQVDKGNISLKDLVRLQSLLLDFQNERMALQKNVIEEVQNIQLITGITEPIIPTLENSDLEKFRSPKYDVMALVDSALTKNPEYLSGVKIVESQELYLKLQKSLSVPDVVTGLSYDQRGGAFQNQVNVTFGIPIPLWNRNKGNVRVAQSNLSQSQFLKTYKRNELITNVQVAWQQWQQQFNQFNSTSNYINQNLGSVYEGIVSNFQKRNISLMEFTDFMESYNQSQIQLNEIKKQWVLSSINLSYVSNVEVF